jgi:hypothetical protein
LTRVKQNAVGFFVTPESRPAMAVRSAAFTPLRQQIAIRLETGRSSCGPTSKRRERRAPDADPAIFFPNHFAGLRVSENEGKLTSEEFRKKVAKSIN